MKRVRNFIIYIFKVQSVAIVLSHLIQVTGNAPEKIQNLIDINLPVCLSVNPLKHLSVLIL